MAGGKTVYAVVGGEGIHAIYSTQIAADAVAENVEGTIVEMHELKTTGKKVGVKRASTPAGEDGNATAKKSKKEEATAIMGIPDVLLGKNVCFLGSMRLKRDLLELSATGCGASITKKTAEADVIVAGSRLSDPQSKDLVENKLVTIDEDEFRHWLVTGEQP